MLKLNRGGLIMLLLALAAGCQTPQPAFEPVLPGIWRHPETRAIQVDGAACTEKGILEYIAVADGGKEYESVFSLACRPSHLHVAMLMAGYEAGKLPMNVRGDYSTEVTVVAPSRPPGTPTRTPPPPEHDQQLGSHPTCVTIEIDVRQSDGSWRRCPVESFLLDRRTGKPPEPLAWAFTGSFFLRDDTIGVEYFVADRERSLIGLWYDPTALLNVTENVGNPYRGDNLGLELNAKTLPPRGTPVRVRLIPIAPDTQAR